MVITAPVEVVTVVVVPAGVVVVVMVAGVVGVVGGVGVVGVVGVVEPLDWPKATAGARAGDRLGHGVDHAVEGLGGRRRRWCRCRRCWWRWARRRRTSPWRGRPRGPPEMLMVILFRPPTRWSRWSCRRQGDRAVGPLGVGRAGPKAEAQQEGREGGRKKAHVEYPQTA